LFFIRGISVVPVSTAGFGLRFGVPLSEQLQTVMVDNRRKKLNALVEPY
jgi:hypothetical protein